MLKKMEVLIVPCLQDNYAYLLIDKASRKVAAVDPVEPHKITAILKEKNLNLDYILTTHHHAYFSDHSGGNRELAKLFPGIRIYGHDDRIPSLSDKLQHNSTVKLGDSITVKALLTTGHTTGSLSYFVDLPSDKVVFTGDVLFSGGCGRFFEGTPSDMYRSLIEVLSELPDETRVYCGHEYTLNNLKFAKTVDRDNAELDKAFQLASINKITIPSSIGHEKLINPFMRVRHPSILGAMQTQDPVEAMGKLRKLKDNF